MKHNSARKDDGKKNIPPSGNGPTYLKRYTVGKLNT
jgi:hypothetical protein